MEPAGEPVGAPPSRAPDPRAPAASRRLAPAWRPGGLGPLLVLLAASLWATTGLWAKAAYGHGFGPIEAASARGFLAFLCLCLAAAVRPRRFAVAWSDVPLLAGFGVIGLGVFYAIYLACLDRLSVSVAAALLYTAPAFTAALAPFTVGERLGRRGLAALGGALLGVLLVTGALGASGRDVDPLGIGLGLGAGLAYAGYTLFGRASRKRMDALRALFWPTGFGALFLACLAPPWRSLPAHPDAIPALLGLALLATLLPNLLFLLALGRLEAGVAAILATLEPVVAALYGVVLLGEVLGAGQIVGVAAIAASAAWLAISRSAPRPVEEAAAATVIRR
ncbi:MAG TPA: DMT family transporter [Longimicrobiales bacterium]|nr:DMT family transporter [Longimicrobiales bacterium]